MCMVVLSPKSLEFRSTNLEDYDRAVLGWIGLVAEWLACWTQAQKGLGSNSSRDAVESQS